MKNKSETAYDVEIIPLLENIVQSNTKYCATFQLDIERIQAAAESLDKDDKYLLWILHYSGFSTYCAPINTFKMNMQARRLLFYPDKKLIYAIHIKKYDKKYFLIKGDIFKLFIPEMAQVYRKSLFPYTYHIKLKRGIVKVHRWCSSIYNLLFHYKFIFRK